MKKSLPLLIVTSLFIGMAVAVSTSRVSGTVDSNLNQYCGLSLNRQTGQLTKDLLSTLTNPNGKKSSKKKR